jgi:hypothetical protein
LEKLQILTARSTSKGTVAKLMNTEVYDVSAVHEQPRSQPTSNHQLTNGQPASNHHLTTNKKEKKEKKEKKVKTEKKVAPLPAALDTPDFRKAWTGYLDYRKEKRLPRLTERSQEAKLNEMAVWGSDRAMRAIERSIANGWQGIFEDRHSRPQRAPAALPPPPDYKNGNHEF